MSISNQTSDKPTNPATKFIKFKNGKFSYYDKDKKEEIEMELPIKFMVIDELATITGWHDESQSAIYSNEVHSTVREDLTVRAFKGGELAIGKYKNIKPQINNNGGKYTKSVYALDLDTREIVNFHFSGAVLSAWINKEIIITDNAVVIEKTEDHKKGVVKYKTPVFAAMAIDKEIFNKAIELDQNVMRPYFDKYKVHDDSVQEFPEEDLVLPKKEEVKISDLPF